MQTIVLILILAITVEALIQYVKTIIKMLEDKQYKTFATQVAAILIAVLGATMLATMVMASVSVTSRSERVLHASYAAESSLLSSSPNIGSVTVVMPDGEDGTTTSQSIKVMLYSSGGYNYYREGQSK